MILDRKEQKAVIITIIMIFITGNKMDDGSFRLLRRSIITYNDLNRLTALTLCLLFYNDNEQNMYITQMMMIDSNGHFMLYFGIMHNGA